MLPLPQHTPRTEPGSADGRRRGLPSEGLWLGGFLDLRNSATSMSLDGSGAEWNFPLLDQDRTRQVCYHAFLPNLFITAHHDYLMTHRLEPLDAGRTRVVCAWLFPPALVTAGTDTAYAVEFWDHTNAQDWAACESVQRGVSVPGYAPGPLAPEESALRAFLRLYAEACRDDLPLRADTHTGGGIRP